MTMPRTSSIRVLLTEDERAAIERAAAEEERTISSLVRYLLIQHIIRQNKAHQENPAPDRVAA
jgi:uncharacterized protein (DUF1778 family)